jgi:dipeptidyl aminopeptidase/acylaminoacyl peptidase
MQHLRNPGILEGGQVRLGGPPWHDYWRYLRNSPILYVDRVNTPLMMIHGDLDFIALSQAEEFFTALYRQGKPARLVRYWGEDHIISSPANVADSWDRILQWFDMHRKPARSQAAAQPRAQTSVLK